MELVGQFSEELTTVLDGKLPVSRAKMASITRLALKAVKYYKHVVMAVEKFVSKCAPEYKVPGLYVIDSIVRQSRHQFGVDKDNFGPRFSKSFEKTFLHLFMCPSEQKPKIIRVLNLWQKNGVFPPEVIQPLLALAPSPEHTPGGNSQPATEALPPAHPTDPPQSAGGGQGNLDLDSANLIIQQQQSQIQALLQQQQQLQTQASTLLGPALQGLLAQATDSGDIATLLKQTQELAAAQELTVAQQKTNGDPPPPVMSNNRPSSSNREQHTEFNTALLDDFDYSDDEDERPQPSKNTAQEITTRIDDNKPKDSTDHLLEELQEEFRAQKSTRAEQPPPPQPPMDQIPPPLPQHYPPPIAPAPHPPPRPPHPFPPPDMPLPPHMNAPPMLRPPLPSMDFNHRGPPSHPPHYPPPRSPPSQFGNRRGYRSPPGPPTRSRRGRSPSPGRRHSGSWRDRDRDWDKRSPWRRSRSPPHRGDRNRSRTPPHRSPRRRSEENDRPRRGSSSVNKEKHVTVLSTTIWMGHLAKSVGKDQITEACSGHGQVHSVDVVSARGCAYIVMATRPDAVKVLNALRDVKLNGSMCKLAWAPGRGVKGGAYRSFWNLDDGVSVIPWDAVTSQSDLDKFIDGGCIEPNTCPPGMKPPEPARDEPPHLPPFAGPTPGPPMFLPQGMPPPPMPGPPPPLGGPQPPMFPPPQPMTGGHPFPIMPPNNAHLPPRPPGNSDTVDMQIAFSPPSNSEL